MKYIHIYPVNDTKPHETDENLMCQCNPKVMSGETVNGLWQVYNQSIVIHNSWKITKLNQIK